MILFLEQTPEPAKWKILRRGTDNLSSFPSGVAAIRGFSKGPLPGEERRDGECEHGRKRAGGGRGHGDHYNGLYWPPDAVGPAYSFPVGSWGSISILAIWVPQLQRQGLPALMAGLMLIPAPLPVPGMMAARHLRSPPPLLFCTPAGGSGPLC